MSMFDVRSVRIIGSGDKSIVCVVDKNLALVKEKPCYSLQIKGVSDCLTKSGPLNIDVRSPLLVVTLSGRR